MFVEQVTVHNMRKIVIYGALAVWQTGISEVAVLVCGLDLFSCFVYVSTNSFSL